MRLFLSIFLMSSLYNQVRVGEWNSYTSPLEIADMVEMDSLMVCVTNGGVLVYDRIMESFHTYTKMDGLIGTDLSVITVDPFGQFWVGGSSPNGLIQILDKTFSIQETFDMNLTAISDIAVTDSIAFCAFLQNQDWGIMEFRHNSSQYFYKDVYNNWPVTLNEISGIVLFGEKLYVGTDQGLFVGDWKNKNMKDPANWVRYAGLNGNITTLRQVDRHILFVMDKDVYSLDLETGENEIIWDIYHDSYQLKDVMITDQGELTGILNKTFIQMNTDGISWQKQLGEQLIRIFHLKDGTTVLGSTTGLLFLNMDRQSFTRQKPNVMATNDVSTIHVLRDGRVVAGSRKGLMIKESDGWRNIIGIDGDETTIHEVRDYSRFVADTIPVHFGDYIADIEEGPDGLLYCGIRGTYPEPRRHGGGIVIIDIDSPSNFTLIDTSRLDYFADEYLIVKDIEKDASGNLWIADTYATTRFEPLKVLTVDGLWGSFSVEESGNTLSLTSNTIDFDSWGRVWVGSFEDNNNVGGSKNGGVVMLNYTGDPTQPDQTTWTNVNVNQDASTHSVWSLAISSHDILYLLSPKGLIGLTLQFSDSDPVQHYGFTYFPNISFSSGSQLSIDSNDNVWACSPSQGIFVLTSSATYWPDINGITQENSPLLSNAVSSVAFDGNQGLAYIGTNQGINVIKIPFAEKKKSFTSVTVFPSPYHIPSDIPLTIDGLMDNSSCKIMTLTGKVIRTIKSRPEVEGYQAFWDGRDHSGIWIGTGVYLIAVYNENGTSSFSKIAVIRH